MIQLVLILCSLISNVTGEITLPSSSQIQYNYDGNFRRPSRGYLRFLRLRDRYVRPSSKNYRHRDSRRRDRDSRRRNRRRY